MAVFSIRAPSDRTRPLSKAMRLAVLLGSVCLSPVAHAQSTWLANPASSDWNTAANWTPGVPGSSDAAQFNASTTTSVTISAASTSVGQISFGAGAPAYAIVLGNADILDINGVAGASIVNNSSSLQTINSQGTITIATGAIQAGTGGVAVNVTSGYWLHFQNSSTAGTAVINNIGPGPDVSTPSVTAFYGTSSADHATITNSGTVTSSGGTAAVQFLSNSTAGNATITNNSGGVTQFYNNSSAGSATIITNSGGLVFFTDTSTGGSAQIITNAGGTFYLLKTNGGLTVGSIAGAGSYRLGSQALTVGDGTDTTVSGLIGDGGLNGGTGGSLIKVGTGTLTLSGTNSYTGGTTISGGTLQLGDGTSTGSIVGNVVNNATLALDPGSSALTLAGVVSGTGSVKQIGGGTTVLSGANTYTGGTTISAGTIQVTNSTPGTSSVGTGAVTLDGGTFQAGANGLSFSNAISLANGTTNTVDTQANSLTLSGAISDLTTAGALTKTGTGTLILSGANTYTGATNVSGGTLLGGAANAFSAASATTVNGGSTVDLGGFAQTINAVALAGGTLTNGALTGAVTSSGGALSNLGGAMSLVVTGGTTNVTGTNTYAGATSVNGGLLSVNGSSISAVTVNAGGTLGGNGSVGNTTINAGGALAPGNSIGLLTVQGNLVFMAAASYMVEVSPANADRTNVTGTATLGGATVNANFAPGTYVTKQYTIVNAGSVSGTFASLVNTNLPANFTPSLSYDASNAYLNLTLNFVQPSAPNYGGGLSINQQNVANTLVNYFNTTGGIPLVYGTLTPAGLTQASGELATSSQQTTFDAMNLFLGLLTDPFMNRNGSAPSGPGVSGYAEEGGASAYAAIRKTDAFAMFTKAPPVPFVPRWSVWAAGFGGSRSTSGNAIVGSNDTTSSVYGTAVGADYLFSPNTIAGFALAGGGTNFSVAGSGSGRSDLFQAGAYIRHTEGAAYVTAALAYGWQDVTTNRTVTVAGIDQLRAEFDANTYSGRLEGGYRFVVPGFGGLGVTPYAAGQFTTFDLPGYAEQTIVGSSTFALTYAAKSVTDVRSELGIRTDKSFLVQDGVLTLRTRFAWAHDYDPDRAIAATFQALPGASFVVNGAAQASDAALTTASIDMKWRNGWSAAATFEGEFSDVTNSYAGKGVVRYQW